MKGKPRYSTLVKWLNVMIGDVESELDAAPESVDEHPIMKGKAQNVEKARRVLERAQDAVEKRKRRQT